MRCRFCVAVASHHYFVGGEERFACGAHLGKVAQSLETRRRMFPNADDIGAPVPIAPNHGVVPTPEQLALQGIHEALQSAGTPVERLAAIAAVVDAWQGPCADCGGSRAEHSTRHNCMGFVPSGVIDSSPETPRNDGVTAIASTVEKGGDS